MLSEKLSQHHEDKNPIRQIKFENDHGERFRFLVSGDKQDLEKLNRDGLEAYIDSTSKNIVTVFIKKHADYDDDYTPGTHPGFNIYETFCKVEQLLGPLQASESFINSLSDLTPFEGGHPTFEGIQRLVTELGERAQTSLDLNETLTRQLQETATKLDKQYGEDEAMARQLHKDDKGSHTLLNKLKATVHDVRESQQSDPIEKKTPTLKEPKNGSPRH